MIKRYYSIVVGLLPLLFLVNIEISGLTFDRILLSCFAVIFFIQVLWKKRMVIKQRGVLFSVSIFCIYISLNSLFFKSSGIVGICFTWIVWMLCIIYGSQNYLDINIMRRTIEFISIVASVFIVFQTVLMYTIGVNLVLIPYNIYRASAAEPYTHLLKSGFDYLGIARPSAFFLEPAQFAEYSILGLIFALFEGNSKKGTAKAVIITTGILFSTSGIGLLLSAFIWGYVIFTSSNGYSVNNKVKIVTIIGITCIIVFLLLEYFGALDTILSRLTINGENSAWKARNQYNEDIFLDNIWVGVGYGKSFEHWITGLYLLIWDIGIIGVALLGISLLFVILKTDSFGKLIIVCFVIMLIFSDVSDLMYFTYYLSAAFTATCIKKQTKFTGNRRLYYEQ